MSNEPGVVDKSQVDINLQGGIDESLPEYGTDWTKRLLVADNVLVEGPMLKSRLGAGKDSLVPTGHSPIFRVVPTDNGIATIAGPNFTLQQRIETQDATSTSRLEHKGRMPEFSVRTIKSGSDVGGDISTTEDTFATNGVATGVIGVAETSKYYCIAYNIRPTDLGDLIVGTSSATKLRHMALDIIDKNSENVVVSYRAVTAEGGLWSMVGVDDRYLHLYLGNMTISKPSVYVIDTESASFPPTGLDTTIQAGTSLTVCNVADVIAGVVPIAGASVAITRGDNGSININKIVKVNNSQVVTASATVSGFNAVSGIDTDGTSFWIVGTAVP